MIEFVGFSFAFWRDWRLHRFVEFGVDFAELFVVSPCRRSIRSGDVIRRADSRWVAVPLLDLYRPSPFWLEFMLSDSLLLRRVSLLERDVLDLAVIGCGFLFAMDVCPSVSFVDVRNCLFSQVGVEFATIDLDCCLAIVGLRCWRRVWLHCFSLLFHL